MGMYDKVRNFVSRRTAEDQELLERLVRESNSAPSLMNYGDIFTRRNNVYKEIPIMMTDPIIASSVAVVMETAFQPSDDNSIFTVSSPYAKVKEELDGFHSRYNADETLLTTSFNLLLYGNLPIRMEYSPSMEFERYSFVPDFTKVTPIVVSNRTLGYMYNGEFHDAYEFVYAQHLYFKDLGGPSAKSKLELMMASKDDSKPKLENEFVIAPSYLSSAVKPWKSIKIIEDALLLQRLDVSNFMRIISVNVGESVFAKNAVKLLNFYRQLFKKVRRVSFDGDGMSSQSTNNEYEVIIPTTGSQNVDVKEVGGQIEIRALRDLEIQYKKLFSALRIQASMIGFSEDTPSSLGESGAASRWDERFGRLIKAVRMSATSAMKQIDVNYLRSRGYDVTEADFRYNYLAASTVEDSERRDTLKTYMETISQMVSTLDSLGQPYNKNYVVKELFSSALASTAVDMDRLFTPDDKIKELTTSSGSVLLRADKVDNYRQFVKAGFISEEELKLAIGPDGSGKPITGAKSHDPVLSYNQYQALGDILSAGRVVNLSGAVHHAPADITAGMTVVAKNIDIPISMRLLTSGMDIPADILASGGTAVVGDLYLYDGGHYLVGEDLSNYLYMKDQGARTVHVKRVWKETI
jgi:hypothetical protein